MKASPGERILALMAAMLCASFGTIMLADPTSPFTVLLLGAAVILVLVAITGEATLAGRGPVQLLTAALLAYAGIQLLRFAASEYRKSARLTDPGNDFVIQGVLALAAAALIGTAAFLFTRRLKARD